MEPCHMKICMQCFSATSYRDEQAIAVAIHVEFTVVRFRKELGRIFKEGTYTC